jgi:beta-phosphoglucomutase-like phosphatase (HAD superfamily)
MKKIRTKAVIFDYDGTLTYGDYNNIFKSLYQVLGYATDRNSEYYETYLDFKEYKFDYDRWVQINEEDFKKAGLTKEIFESVTDEIKLIAGLEDVLKGLHKKGIKL